MAIHFSSLDIDCFRGIRELKVPSLNHINIITGDNNCGKTSVLEAILLLRNPNEFSNVIEIANLRRQLLDRTRESIFSSFISLFPNDASSNLVLSVSACYQSNDIKYKLAGAVSRFLVVINEINKQSYSSSLNYNNLPSEDIGFKGKINFIENNNSRESDVLFKRLDDISNISLPNNKYINIVYMAPFIHLRGGAFSYIIRNEDYKKSCIKFLQLFDSNIQDLILTQEEYEVFPTETIVHSKFGNMALSTFGDSIKKVITFASKIIEAADGILLVDDMDTTVHPKYYDQFFSFVESACKQFNVQLFMTTNNVVAIESLLGIQNYETTNEDLVNVITLKKEENVSHTLSRVFKGKDVFLNKDILNS